MFTRALRVLQGTIAAGSVGTVLWIEPSIHITS
ncbi:MAG: hypothetical protein S4CHLAM7_12920 [Chlamydiae bacterium]|nr:hypothetical protein [Chlamydiota bacterium]